MKKTHTLVRHSDIQRWVSARKGQPALTRFPNRMGEMQSRLSLKFSGPQAKPNHIPSQDDGISPCSWNVWLAELDRQDLALKVSDAQQDARAPAFEFVERKPLN